MNLRQVTALLCNALAEGYAQLGLSAWSATPLVFENEIARRDGKLEDEWIRMNVDELASDQQTMGGQGARRFTRQCAVYVQVFALVEGRATGFKGGADRALELGELVRRFFEGRSFSGAKFRNAHIGRPTLDKDSKGRWCMRLVECPFYFQERA